MPNGKKRIFICRATPVAPDPRVEKIARSLADAGYIITILAWDMTGKYPAFECLNGVSLHRYHLQANFGRGLINLFHQIRWQWVLLGWLIKRRTTVDIIHACDFDTVLPALIVGWLWRKKVVYDIFDFYADMLRATPSIVKKIIRQIDLWVIDRVDGVILADDSRVEQITGSAPKHCAVIYNCLDDLQKPVEKKAVQEPGMRLSYVGNLQIERGLLPLIDVLKKRPELTLDLAGFGGDEDEILSAVKGLPNVTWHGRVNYERALALNENADVLIATYDPVIPNHRYSSPNKVFEAMLLGKPIIVARHTNMDTIIEREECGLVVDYGDHAALEEALKRLIQEKDLRSRLGDNARRAFLRTYNWKEMGKRLTGLYEALER
jgi:glycosyltransferase involved in cell wall biosynthesis